MKAPYDADIQLLDIVDDIKDVNGNIAWMNNFGDSTRFWVKGKVPVFDPFGQILDFDIFLQRVETS